MVKLTCTGGFFDPPEAFRGKGSYVGPQKRWRQPGPARLTFRGKGDHLLDQKTAGGSLGLQDSLEEKEPFWGQKNLPEAAWAYMAGF